MYYLILLITFTLLSVPATHAQTKPARGKHNGKIVFTSDRNYHGLSIWTMNPDGSSPTRLTSDKNRGEKLPDFSPVYDSSPVWSPDGTKIAFISNRDYLFSLYVMNADGSNAQRLTETLEPGEPAWSPDGGKIAFTAGVRFTVGMGKASTNIYIVNVDGTGLTQLTRNTDLNSRPAWSPDGKQIVFTSNRDGQAKVWAMDADGSNQRELPNTNIDKKSPFYNHQPTWSPDGSKVLFSYPRVCTNDYEVGIYVMNADGSNGRMLTNDPNSCGVYSSPRWSPDGTKIIASFKPRPKVNSDPPTQIIVMDADGSNRVNISNRSQYRPNTGSVTFVDVDADWQPLLAPLQSSPSIIGLSAPAYTVYNDAGKVDITIKRTGNLNDVVSCFYITVLQQMTIKYPDDAATGTLRFAAGESSKTISIRVEEWRGADSYKIMLSDNEGNATFLGGIKEATLTILKR